MSIWRKSAIFPDYYSVSDDGKVRSERNGKILRPALDKSGYHYYVLCVNGDRRTVKAHRLIALSFIPNPQNKPTINHKNGIRTDNRVVNLEWATHKEQSNNPLTYQKLVEKSKHTDYRAMGLLRDYGRQPIEVLKKEVQWVSLGEFPSQKAAAEFTSVSPGKVSQCVSGQKKSCKGYAFKPIAVTKKRFPEKE